VDEHGDHEESAHASYEVEPAAQDKGEGDLLDRRADALSGEDVEAVEEAEQRRGDKPRVNLGEAGAGPS
jgi:hypothetical protein